MIQADVNGASERATGRHGVAGLLPPRTLGSRTVGLMEAKGAALQTIMRWASEGERAVDVTLRDRPTTFTVGLGVHDVLATQGHAQIHIDRCGLIQNRLPDHLMVARDADV
jgi:hypothetical protein